MILLNVSSILACHFSSVCLWSLVCNLLPVSTSIKTTSEGGLNPVYLIASVWIGNNQVYSTQLLPTVKVKCAELQL